MNTIRIIVDVPADIVEKIDAVAESFRTTREVVATEFLRRSVAPAEDDVDEFLKNQEKNKAAAGAHALAAAGS